MTHYPSRAQQRSWKTVALGMLIAATVGLASCTGVPSAGAPVDYTQLPGAGPAANPVNVAPGLTPLEIVRGFYQEAIKVDQDQYLTSARAYLTTAAKASWQLADTSSRVIILAANPRIEPDAKDENKVLLSGVTDGYLEADGSYQSTESLGYQVTMTLAQEDGQWRIDTLPADLIMTVADFNVAYTQREVYFLDHTASVVVPDRRWIVNANQQQPELVADLLVDKMLQGPSAFLKPAVRSEFSGLRVSKNIKANDQSVLQVDLQVDTATISARPQFTAATRRALAAQLVYTLSRDAVNIAITLDGEPLDPKQPVWTASSLSSFNPSAVPGTDAAPVQGYYVAEGGIASLDGQPVWGNAGSGYLNLTQAAMSASTGALAAVGATGDEYRFYIGAPWSGSLWRSDTPRLLPLPPPASTAPVTRRGFSSTVRPNLRCSGCSLRVPFCRWIAPRWHQSRARLPRSRFRPTVFEWPSSPVSSSIWLSSSIPTGQT
ncbi:hypothetical protein EH165_04190 [Nakamurella antarctica]|uniref:Uncharacterized protein n=1 Tax=Nakamurella antarctica TaxID=1902245 RepID=A0A3G8ZUT3_9ACTN|nr:GerMN domain-containing protein [Nakamurella antarctica]AZI57481.1 hypothetical protein EH165_04190 [Nakamurella antarctica]